MTQLFSILGVGFVLAASACGSEQHPTTPGGAGGAGPIGGAGAASGASASGPASTAGAGSGSAGSAGSGNAGSAGAASGSVAGASGSTANGEAGRSSAAGSGGASAPPMLPPLVTSAPGAYWKTDGALTDATNNASADVTVNEAAIAQTWEGFGAAFSERGFSFLGSHELRAQAMTLLFSASEGAAFAWGRIPIGASDFAIDRYTLADTGPDVIPNEDESNRPAADISLDGFSLARDKEKLIPYIKAAQAVKPNLRFWANPWTPPVWMKTGFRKSDGWTTIQRPSYYDGGSMKSDALILSSYARYFTKFVEGYKAQGIDIELVSPQTEPTWEQSHPSCLWDDATYATFLGQHLVPAMTQIGVKVMLGTLSNAEKDFGTAAAALADNSAKNLLAVIGVQWGALSDHSKLTGLGSKLPVWATEHKGGNYPWNPSGFPPYVHYAPNDQAYGVESWGYIREAITQVKVTSYSAWNMVLDKAGWSNDTTREWAQNALLVADSGTLTPTPAYYVFRHLSQYVVPGATVVGTTGGEAIAFKNPDGSLVAVMFNSGAEKSSYVVAIGGKKFQFSMPSSGWATVLYKPN
jgi:glucosylceramidase